MKVRFWGTRGSLATPGTETVRYGGNTSCIQVTGSQGTVLILDAGTGLMPLGLALPKNLRRVDLLLSHLHLDHIQGLGFFAPLYNPNMTVHIWGPASTMSNLRSRLIRYLSPPLFPVQFRDLPCQVELHHVPCREFEIEEFRVKTWLVCHPGPTVGFRISTSGKTLAYMPDHEPFLGMKKWPASNEWVSGYDCAYRADVLIHDAQYTTEQYTQRIGWGHSDLLHTMAFAERAEAKTLYTFHHDPAHSDIALEQLTLKAVQEAQTEMPVVIAREGESVDL